MTHPSVHAHGAFDRRRFLASTAATAAAGVTLSTFPFGMASTAAAATGPRSLVCVFLAGGADSFNMFLPLDHNTTDQTYETYRRTRGALAVNARNILPIGNGDFGLHPLLPGLASLAEQDRLATVMNVGPLSRPTTRADYLAQRQIPQSLFAHDAQQKLWQTAQVTTTGNEGWGGAITAAVANGAGVAPSFSLNGSNAWQAAQGAKYARLSPTVPISRLAGYDGSMWNWIPNLDAVAGVIARGQHAAAVSVNAFDRAAETSIADAIATTEQLQEATASSESNDVGMEDIDQNRLARQLEQVARLIKNREALGMPRQIFFVRMGGWDTHGEQAERWPALLTEFNEAITKFAGALDNLDLADSVTTFTASDFGRTLTINGDGTDHGWGGHAFVFGGAVRGGHYGTFPSYSLDNNPDDVGENQRDFAGRLIPSTSVGQYSATLARWMGLSEPQINAAIPHLANFDQRDLGFLR